MKFVLRISELVCLLGSLVFQNRGILAETAGNPPNPLPFLAKKAGRRHRFPGWGLHFPAYFAAGCGHVTQLLAAEDQRSVGVSYPTLSFLRSQTQLWPLPKCTTKKTGPWRVNGKLDERNLSGATPE